MKRNRFVRVIFALTLGLVLLLSYISLTRSYDREKSVKESNLNSYITTRRQIKRWKHQNGEQTHTNQYFHTQKHSHTKGPKELVNIITSYRNIPKLHANAQLPKRTVKAKHPALQEKSLDVYIVEEHHEVVPYWFAAAEKGVIPKSGNTLIHIDGHSDMALPFNIPGYPYFRWPYNSELKYFMQSNDMFIQAAAMTGLVDRVIWVWPAWDVSNHESDYVKHIIYLGFYRNVTDTSNTNLCMCHRNATFVECKHFPIIADVKQFYINETLNGFDLPEQNCSVEKTMIFEEIHEKTAEDYLRNERLITDTESIFLDLDEDYYGCTYAIRPLLASSLTMVQVEDLHYFIQSIFCPNSTSQENATDLFLGKVISLLYTKQVCDVLVKSNKTKSKCSTVAQINPYKYLTDLLMNLISHNNTLLCQNQGYVDSVMKSIIQEFLKLSGKQMKALHEVGFCLSTSPKTYAIHQNMTFGVCYGVNTPEETAVNEYIPTKAEIHSRSMLLRNTIAHLKRYSPKLVTLCRSVRDGYTPRQYFSQIEEDILHILNFTLDRQVSLHFDEDLLGHKKGLSSRLKQNAIFDILYDI